MRCNGADAFDVESSVIGWDLAEVLSGGANAPPEGEGVGCGWEVVAGCPTTPAAGDNKEDSSLLALLEKKTRNIVPSFSEQKTHTIARIP